MQNRILAYSNHFLVLALFILLLSPVNSYGLFGKPQFKNDIDSLQSLVQQYPTDTAKFKVLYSYFWIHYDADFNSAKPIGEWAFNVIRNSKNLKACADGYDIKGNIFKEEEKFDSAYFCFESALAISKKIGYTSRTSWSYYHLGELNVVLGNHDSAIHYMKLYANVLLDENNLRDSHEVIRDIAEMYKRSGQYDSALVYYNKRLSLNEKMADKGEEVISYMQISKFYQDISDKKKSIAYLKLALKEVDKNADLFLSSVYVSIADYFIESKNYQMALEYCKKGMEKKGTDPFFYQLLSKIYLGKGDEPLALKYALLSIENAKRYSSRHTISDAYQTFALVYEHSEKDSLAISNYQMCYKINCPSCPKIFFHEALIKIADLYLNLNNFQKALDYYKEALELAQKYHAIHEIALSNFKIGNYYQKLHQPQTAEKYYLQSIKVARQTRSISLIKNIADTLNGFYYKRYHINAAYSYLNLSQQMGDSLSKIDREASLEDLKMKFDLEKIKKENEAKQLLSVAEIKRQKVFRNFLLLICGSLGSLGLIIFLNYRRKKKDNLLLTLQKKEIEKISQKLHEADQAKLHFFTNISHEFRTPLTLILGPIEKLIKEYQNNDNLVSFLKIIQRNSYQLFNLINQLLDIRKLDSGNIKLQVAAGNIAAFCKGINSTFNHLAEENKITYTFHSDGEDITGWFDPDIIEKALNNLLSNAFKYTPQGKEIRVSLSQLSNSENRTDKVKIDITDTGKGIPEDQVKYVFDRYYQVENSNTGFNTGTGIGLAYTKELIELHKGELNVQSTINRGTTFTIILPIHETYYSKYEKSASELHLKTRIDNDRLNYLQQIIGKEKEVTEDKPIQANENEQLLLIIEDNNDLRVFIKSIFAADFKIVEADNGVSGLALANELIPDVIISDIMMPEMNGLELCKKLKNNIHTNHIPILLLTAKAGDENEIEGLKTGADDYLSKPFNSEILEARVHGLILQKIKLREYFTRQFILNPKEIKLTSPEDEFLKKAVMVVEENISNPNLDVQFLIKELGVSNMQLFRKLKATTNYSANQFIRNIRLKRAAQLIKQNSLNISEVLYQTGFNSRSYFTACFKEMYGCLPSEYALRNNEIKEN